MSVLSAPYMHDEAAAFKHVEAIVWGDAPVCAHCGVVDVAYGRRSTSPYVGAGFEGVQINALTPRPVSGIAFKTLVSANAPEK